MFGLIIHKFLVCSQSLGMWQTLTKNAAALFKRLNDKIRLSVHLMTGYVKENLHSSACGIICFQQAQLL